jgi:hypothetical protein
MAVRNLHQESIDNFTGLNTIDDAVNLTPNEWIEASNVIVSASGSATALRSPRTLSDNTLTFGTSPSSIFNADFNATGIVFVDVVTAAGPNQTTTYTMLTTGSTNTLGSIRTGQANSKWKRLMVNQMAYGVNGSEAIQISSSPYNIYKIGIDAPAAAPAVSAVAGGALTLNVGVTVSYAYRNSATGHVGKCSAASANSGPIGGGTPTLRVATVASAQTGVDGIVIFISTDGGANRFLVIDAAGAPIVYANATANVDFIAAFLLDTNTQESAYNARPSDLANQIFQHQGRVFLLGYTATATLSTINYSGQESIGIGLPTESYPPLNVIAVPARGEIAQCGISTPVGAFILSDHDAYLLQGTVSDITVSSQNTLSASYALNQFQWGLGTRSPNSLAATPYGTVWVDQHANIQLWPFAGKPQEIGRPLRGTLKNVATSAGSLSAVEGVFFKNKEQEYYALKITAGSVTLIIIGFHYDAVTGELSFSYGVSDIAPSCLAVNVFSNTQRTIRLLMGTTNGVQEILDLDTAGSGWSSSQSLYFGVMTGNFKGNQNFNHLHSIRFDGAYHDTEVQVRKTDDSQNEAVVTEVQDSTDFALLDRYGVHHKMRFTFPKDDTVRRDLQNLRISYAAKGRVI